MTRDTTLGAAWRQLRDLGYGVTSATHPDRIVTCTANRRNRDRFISLADHPAAIMLHPTADNGCDFEDPEKRGVVALTLTAYLLADPKQLRAVMAVLAEYELTGGPSRVDGFGNQVRLLQWNGPPIYDDRYQARLCFASDNHTVVLTHAIEPEQIGVYSPSGGWYSKDSPHVATNILPIDGQWTGGHILDTPRRKLPQLHKADLRKLIDDVEEARWAGRPLATAKDAA